jgi:hypothetical protein
VSSPPWGRAAARRRISVVVVPASARDIVRRPRREAGARPQEGETPRFRPEQAPDGREARRPLSRGCATLEVARDECCFRRCDRAAARTQCEQVAIRVRPTMIVAVASV